MAYTLDTTQELSNITNGVWFISDLHLSDRELSTTTKLVDNSLLILDRIIDVLEQNTNIHSVIFLGDIQHRTPSNRRTVVKWVQRFNRIREILEPRRPTSAYTIKDFESRVQTTDYHPLITIKGNHDIDKQGRYTLFDELIDLEVIAQYDCFVYDNTCYYLHDYDDTTYNYDDTMTGIDHHVLVTHNTFIFPGADHWILNNESHQDPDDVPHDLVVIGHLHSNYGLFESDTTALWVPGCLARTSQVRDVSQQRDFGTSGIIANDTKQLFLLETPLISYREMFKTEETQRRQNRERALEDFSLNLDVTSVTYDTYETTIQNANSPQEVKDKAIGILNALEEQRNRN